MDMLARGLKTAKPMLMAGVVMWELLLLGVGAYVFGGHISGARPIEIGVLPFGAMLAGLAIAGIVFYAFGLVVILRIARIFSSRGWPTRKPNPEGGAPSVVGAREAQPDGAAKPDGKPLDDNGSDADPNQEAR